MPTSVVCVTLSTSTVRQDRETAAIIPQILQTLLAESTTNQDIHILRLKSSISVLPLAILRSASTATRIAQQVFGCTRVAERFITLKYHQDIITQ